MYVAAQNDNVYNVENHAMIESPFCFPTEKLKIAESQGATRSLIELLLGHKVRVEVDILMDKLV